MVALNDLSGGPFDLSQTIKLASTLEDVARRFDAAPRPTTDEAIDRFNRTVVRLTHALNSTLYTAAGRFDQDPAAELPVLPLLGRVKDLATLPRDGDEYGFVETAMIRGRNEVEATLRDATNEIESYLGQAR